MRTFGTVFISAVFLLFPATAAADSYDPTALTAAQIFANASHARGKLQNGTYRGTSTITSGGVVRAETTYMNSENDSMSTATGGGFTSTWGTFHKTSWSQNKNGIVTISSGFRSSVDPNALAFAHPDDPKYNVRVLGVTQTEPKQYVVELNPPGGVDSYRYYDAKTFFLMREVTYGKDHYKHVHELSDYRTAFGLTFPYFEHWYDGRPQNDSTDVTHSFERTQEAVSFAIPKSRPLYSASGTSPIPLPATITPNGVVIRADIGGRGVDFLLDSGASGIFIDPGVAHQLGLVPFGKNRETVGGGDVDLGDVRVPKMSIGALEMTDIAVTTLPFSQDAGNARVVGILGYDFIASGILAIDFPKGQVLVYPKAAFDPASMGLFGMPAELDDGIPRVAATVENKPAHFLIDTGAFATTIYQQYINTLGGADFKDTIGIGTAGGSMNATVQSVSNLVFGNVLFKHVEVVTPVGSTFDIADYDGMIGRNMLDMYRIFFDYPDNMVYVANS